MFSVHIVFQPYMQYMHTHHALFLFQPNCIYMSTQTEIDQLKSQLKAMNNELWAEKNEKAKLQKEMVGADARIMSQKMDI